ncbi:cysteine hydrolase [Sphingopyxis lindanitolerans]|uniref:Cysteine hydrolase n=1 Tax=Sphingopyxis lindanitolerans TaxID=2054227 RepID=A0A2S8B6Z9_9SPHN|nr:isochorismatase family cysteine hydrolase [Sphingopyxis lindanitolerans]PQM28181.1 cysteine hydrolase [Sphingopyxis lindanitolerans]
MTILRPDIRRDDPYPAAATALLLVDMQRIWLEPGRNPGHPDWDAGHPFHRDVAARAIPNQARLLAAARAGGVEVIHTIIRSLTRDGRDRSLDHKMTPLHVGPDDPLALPVPELAVGADEILLPKTSSGVFNSTNIDYVLRNLGITHLVVAGIMTDQCVDMAVRDAADRGFVVTCVGDACAAATAERHSHALGAFGGYCWVADTDTVEARFRAMRAP